MIEQALVEARRERRTAHLSKVAELYRAYLAEGRRGISNDIARDFGVTPSTARSWIHRARADGLLGEGLGRGRPGERRDGTVVLPYRDDPAQAVRVELETERAERSRLGEALVRVTEERDRLKLITESINACCRDGEDGRGRVETAAIRALIRGESYSLDFWTKVIAETPEEVETLRQDNTSLRRERRAEQQRADRAEAALGDFRALTAERDEARDEVVRLGRENEKLTEEKNRLIEELHEQWLLIADFNTETERLRTIIGELGAAEAAEPPSGEDQAKSLIDERWLAGVRWAAAESDAQGAWRDPVYILDITDHLRLCADNPERKSVIDRGESPARALVDKTPEHEWRPCPTCGYLSEGIEALRPGGAE